MNYTWEKIKERIYFADGSLRDIYINNITEEQWGIWINYVNNNYNVEWNNKNKIDFDIIKQNWKENNNPGLAKIFIGNIQINCHFFCDFENDIDPNEVQYINDHNSIIKYMKNISELFNTAVFLSVENAHFLLNENVHDYYFLKVYKDEIIWNIE